MDRTLSSGSHSSLWSTTAVYPAASSPGGHTPESPGGGITDALRSLDVNGTEQQQAHNLQYTYPTTGSYHIHRSHPSPSSTQATVGSSSSQGNTWVEYYDFIARVDQGQAPYWQLKANYSPTAEYPRIVPVPGADATPRSEHLNTCLAPGCDSKPFKRKADLERHYQQVHWDTSTKTSYPCDYSRCPRSIDYFYRRDHCRDHYREYHKEDLCRRSSSSSSSSKKENDVWWADRGISKKWWRCSKCLRRVSIQQDGFECRDCKAPCEAERRRRRGFA